MGGNVYVRYDPYTDSHMRSQASRHSSRVLLRIYQVIVHIIPCLYHFLSTFYIQAVVQYRTTISPELGAIVSRPSSCNETRTKASQGEQLDA
jgi:hypothetical protein